MLTELAEYGHKIEEKVKATKRKIKEQGNNSDMKESGDQNNSLYKKEEINIQPKHNEETRIQKNEERLRNLWDNFQHSNIQIIGVPGGEEEEQEIENIMKENVFNLTEETDFQEVQEAQRVTKKLDPKKDTPRHIIIILPKIKDKGRILKAVREKQRVTYQGIPIRLSADFLKEILQARRS